jgi:hypothetical protein
VSDTEKPIHATTPPPPSFTEVLDSISKDKHLSIEGKLLKIAELQTVIMILHLDLASRTVDLIESRGLPLGAIPKKKA